MAAPLDQFLAELRLIHRRHFGDVVRRLSTRGRKPGRGTQTGTRLVLHLLHEVFRSVSSGGGQIRFAV
jgi:hypothetical protein